MLIDLVIGTGYHQVGVGEHIFLGIYTPIDVVGLFDTFSGEAGGKKSLSFVPAQRMPGVDERNTELVGLFYTHITSIGIVTVYQGREPHPLDQPIRQVVGKGVEVVPQLLFRYIFFWSAVYANDPGALAERLFSLRVILADRGIHNPPGNQVDSVDLGMLCQCHGKIHHIFRLAAGVRVAAQFQFMPTDKTVDAQHANIQAFNFCRSCGDIPLTYCQCVCCQSNTARIFSQDLVELAGD